MGLKASLFRLSSELERFYAKRMGATTCEIAATHAGRIDCPATFRHKENHMNTEQIKEFMQGGEWLSLAPELRPSAIKNADGSLKPFYLTRAFKYAANDAFELAIVNSADAYGKIPLARILIKGHIAW